jgi:rubrerythrin
MVSGPGSDETGEEYPEEYVAYVRSLADGIVFQEAILDREIGNIKDAQGALDFAIDNERSSIIYYEGIKNLVSISQRTAIDKVIAEEQRHYVQLSDLKKEL